MTQAIGFSVIGLSTIRSKMSTRGRLVLSVFVIAWMNATLQPCLMAMEMSPNESTTISATAEHGGHQNHAAINEDHACPHCPPSASHDGDSCVVKASSECDILPEAKPGERILKIELSDTFDDAHSSYHNQGLDRAPPLLVTISPNCEKPTLVFGPSISIRNCVFLK
jgi:hypothetical protein